MPRSNKRLQTVVAQTRVLAGLQLLPPAPNECDSAKRESRIFAASGLDSRFRGNDGNAQCGLLVGCDSPKSRPLGRFPEIGQNFPVVMDKPKSGRHAVPTSGLGFRLWTCGSASLPFNFVTAPLEVLGSPSPKKTRTTLQFALFQLEACSFLELTVRESSLPVHSRG